MGVAFLLFIPMASTVPNSAPLLGLVGVLFVFTVAELLISPVSLSLATKLAPEVFHTQMVALLFLSIALGTAMAGVLAGYYDADRRGPVLPLDRPRVARRRRRGDARVEADPPPHGGRRLDVLEALGWGALAASSLVVGAVLALVRTWSATVVGLVLGFGAGALISARQRSSWPRRALRHRRHRRRRASGWRSAR